MKIDYEYSRNSSKSEPILLEECSSKNYKQPLIYLLWTTTAQSPSTVYRC